MDFSGQEALGQCPKCTASVFTTTATTTSAKNPSAQPKSTDFRSGKIILQQPIDAAQMKNCSDSRTDLLKGIRLNRTRRKFSAYLVNQDGKVGSVSKKAPAPKTAAKRPKSRQCNQKRRFTGARHQPGSTIRSKAFQRETSADGSWRAADKAAARIASMACGRGK